MKLKLWNSVLYLMTARTKCKLSLFVFSAQRFMLWIGLDFAHIPWQDKLRLIDACSFKLPLPHTSWRFISYLWIPMVVARDMIGKEYAVSVWVRVYFKCILWDFTHLLDLHVHLFLIQIYYCTYKFIIAKIFTMHGQKFYLFCNIKHTPYGRMFQVKAANTSTDVIYV